jgi:cyanophycin synthetase
VRALADVAAKFRPDRIVLKDIDGFMRGRQSGEVADILHAQLLLAGVAANHIDSVLDETAAATSLIEWARADDVIALPVHATRARAAVIALLDRLELSNWHPGEPLPTATAVDVR